MAGPPGARVEWIDRTGKGRLRTQGRPPGGAALAAGLAALRAGGVDVVVSLLEAREAAALGLDDEARAAEAAGLRFVAHAVPDFGVPGDRDAFEALVRDVVAWLEEDLSVVVHCHGGTGRSSVLAACVLVAEGVPADEAFARIATARGAPVPETAAQRAWVEAPKSPGERGGDAPSAR